MSGGIPPTGRGQEMTVPNVEIHTLEVGPEQLTFAQNAVAHRLPESIFEALEKIGMHTKSGDRQGIALTIEGFQLRHLGPLVVQAEANSVSMLSLRQAAGLYVLLSRAFTGPDTTESLSAAWYEAVAAATEEADRIGMPTEATDMEAEAAKLTPEQFGNAPEAPAPTQSDNGGGCPQCRAAE